MQTGPQQEEMGHAKERKNEWAVQEQLNRLEEEKGFGMDYKMISLGKDYSLK
jgi:lysozyme family protein